MTFRSRHSRLARAVLGAALGIGMAPSAAHSEGPAVIKLDKPAPAGVGNADPAQMAREQERRNREAAEKAEDQRRAALEAARTKGDLARDAFETKYHQGPVTEKNRKEFEIAPAAYRQAIAMDPEGEIGSYCRQRLAGAYMFVQQLDEAGRILNGALSHARTPQDQLEAMAGLASFELQSRNRPATALPLARAMQVAAESISDESARARWRVSAAQLVAACEAKLAKSGGR